MCVVGGWQIKKKYQISKYFDHKKDMWLDMPWRVFNTSTSLSKDQVLFVIEQYIINSEQLLTKYNETDAKKAKNCIVITVRYLLDVSPKTLIKNLEKFRYNYSIIYTVSDSKDFTENHSPVMFQLKTNFHLSYFQITSVTPSNYLEASVVLSIYPWRSVSPFLLLYFNS